jgi:hypothetical protein
MSAKSSLRPYMIRFLIVLAISVVFAVAFNEASYLLQKDQYDRAPKTIELVIPAGTAEQVDAGQEVTAIPQEMVFVLGDVLEVVNHDSVSHQLGPVWVPPGSKGTMVMDIAREVSYSCSFSTSRYLGLDIRQPTTLGTRLTGLAISAPTVTVLLFIYSLLVFPINEPDEKKLEPVFPEQKA